MDMQIDKTDYVRVWLRKMRSQSEGHDENEERREGWSRL